MLKGVRVSVKYFTLGLLAGLLVAPRKGDDTRALLVERGREYLKELMSSGQQDFQAMHEKMQPLMEERDKKLQAILTAAQYNTWKEGIEPSLRPRRQNNSGNQ